MVCTLREVYHLSSMFLMPYWEIFIEKWIFRELDMLLIKCPGFPSLVFNFVCALGPEMLQYRVFHHSTQGRKSSWVSGNELIVNGYLALTSYIATTILSGPHLGWGSDEGKSQQIQGPNLSLASKLLVCTARQAMLMTSFISADDQK